MKGLKSKAEILVPLISIVAINLLSIISLECCIIAFLVFPVMISSYYIFCAKRSTRTNIFFIFLILSGVYLLGLFEFYVPLLELLPQENFIFITMLFITVFLFYKTFQQSSLNRLGTSEAPAVSKDNDQTTVNLIAAEEKAIESDEEEAETSNDRNSCTSCRKYIPARTFHCQVCKSCVIGRDHHNYFFNCCIGRFNHKYFLMACICCFACLILFANLTLTSICHPFPIFRVFGINVLLPDDCGEVFHETEIALCFVGAIYAIELAMTLLLVIIQQIVLISKGTTSTEYWFKGERNSRKYNCFRNWKNFCYI